MSRPLPSSEPIAEIASLDDLRRLAGEVRTQKKPRLVSIAGGGEITLAPAKKKRSRMSPEEKAQADDDDFRSAAGSWEGLFDPEEFKRQIKASRGSNRPFIEITFPDE